MDVQRHSEAFQAFQTMKIIKTKAPMVSQFRYYRLLPTVIGSSNQKQNLCLKVTFE